MNLSHSLPRSLCIIGVAAAVGLAACERTGPVAAPGVEKVTGEYAAAGLTTLRFEVSRQGLGTPVENATISVYLNPNATTAPTLCTYDQVVTATQNCWLLTDPNGIAQIQVPNGSDVGYLARVLPPEWLTQLTSVIVPPLSPGGLLTSVANDVGPLTCGPTGPVNFSPSALVQCVNNQYVTANGATEVVQLAMPTVTPRTVIVNDLQGNPTTGVTTYLVEELPQAFPWQQLPAGVKPGFLSFYTPSGNDIPGHGGHLEVYGSSPDGFEIAGTLLVAPGSNTTTVETSSVICANGTENVAYSLTKPVTNPEFSFTDALWAYNAKRGGTSAALVKDLTTTSLVLKFAQTGGPVTVNINQRLRVGGTTRTAGVSVLCTNGDCDVANASYSTPGGGNPLQPHLYQPKPGKLLWVVEGVDPNGASEWTAKASKGTKGVDQIPVPSRSNASSAYAPFSKAFTFCDPDFSFDGGWGGSI